MLIDLQLHSTYSDGYLTPSQLVKFIADRGVKVAALTDHNTVSGLGEFNQACLKYKIKPVIGLELYARLNRKKFNLLWYNFDYKHPLLHALLRDSQKRRLKQARRALMKLAEFGLKIDALKILDKYNHYVPLNHLIDDILLAPGNRKKIARLLDNSRFREEDVIKHLFRNPKINKLEESYLAVERVVKLKKLVGGQLILNHPGKTYQINPDFITKLTKLGLDGLEVLSPHHSLGAILYLQRLARDLQSIATGGSDFHRYEGGRARLKSSYDYFKIEARLLKGVKKIIG